ncbi:OPT superfamily oligopeptide transporter [Gyrodon lividus]|nr:OPT superfamily oligopeptide transporter [Gyrodon lividus]
MARKTSAVVATSTEASLSISAWNHFPSLIISSEDNPHLPALTFRFWVIGKCGSLLVISVDHIIRTWKCCEVVLTPDSNLSSYNILSPKMRYAMPSKRYWRYLNPGPFNIEEHTCITIMQYSQLIGYGFAGILRNLLVRPTYALYPSQLPSISLLQSMHFWGLLNRKKMKYFWMVFTAHAEIVPTWMFPLLTTFSVICLDDNGKLAFVRNLSGAGSSNEALVYPLYWPLQTQVSSWIGLLFGYALMIGCYYGDVFQDYSRGLPFMSTALFNGNGSSYDHSSTLTIALIRKSMLRYMTTTYAVSLLVSYTSMGAAFSHVLLLNWRELWDAFRGFNFLKSTQDFDDVHFQKMKAYKEVRQRIELPNYMTDWGVTFILAVVLGFINSVTGFQLPTGGLVQVIAAFIHPQQRIQNMYAKLYGDSTGYQTLAMLSDLKLGQYAKVPPRAIFTAQFSGTVLGAIFNYALYKSIVGAHRADLQNPIGTRMWGSQEINSAAITWGALSEELYGPGKTYFQIPMGLLYGFLAPFPFYFLHCLFPRQWIWSYLNIPIILTYLGWLPYSVNGMWWPGFLIGLFTQWWCNCLISAALDGGSSIVYFILNFTVFGVSGNAVNFPFWWGNPDPSVISVGK